MARACSCGDVLATECCKQGFASGTGPIGCRYGWAGTLGRMVASAPRIDRRLRRLARRLARTSSSIADVHRAVGRYAQSLGLPRPSYQTIRLLVHEHRARLAARRATADLLIAVDLNQRPATDLLVLLDGLQHDRRVT
jgi:hypothetical protein